MSFSTLRDQRGQTLLIIVLVLVVSLTVGLSIVSRSITNVRTSTDEANSAQALAAAEAGIQKALQNNTNVLPSNFGNGASYQATKADATISTVTVPRDEGADLWLVPHNSDGTPNYTNLWGNGLDTLNIYFGDSTDGCAEAALEVILVSGPSPYNFSKYAFDPCGARKTSNNFDDPIYTDTTQGKNFRASIGNISQGIVARIIPIYDNANMVVTGSLTIPPQGTVISSTGTSASGTVVRKVNAIQRYPSLPVEFFAYGLFVPQ